MPTPVSTPAKGDESVDRCAMVAADGSTQVKIIASDGGENCLRSPLALVAGSERIHRSLEEEDGNGRSLDQRGDFSFFF